MAISICFLGLDSYPVLNPLKGNEYFGGESVQQTLLAKAFNELGYDVNLVSLDYGQPDIETIDGIKVIKTYHVNDGLPVLRFLHPRMTSIIKAMKIADADIYYQSCAGALTGIVARFCQKHNRKFIFRLAHDSDCIPGQQIIPNIRDRKLYEYGLKRADLIAAQGVKQVDLLEQNYHLKSTPVNMTVQMPESNDKTIKDIDILWVNNFREFKRPELLAELARLLPDRKITMIGGPVPGNEALFEEVKSLANESDNLDFKGAISYHEVNGYFSRSRLFVNTSDWEGFPNSFLQAWARGVPVVSFFDPDDLIKSKDLGAVPTDINNMAEKVNELLSDDERLTDIAARSKAFVIESYSPVAMARYYEELLSSL